METTHTSGQLKKLLGLLEQKEMTPERFNKILESGILSDVLDPNACLGNREAVRIALNLAVIETFRLTINHNQSLSQMIVAGHYDGTNDSITAERFPITGEGIVEYEARYFHFDRNISSENAIKEMEEAGWQPAKIEHLLAHGAANPDEQQKHPIVALGSVAAVDGNRDVPCLDRSGSERYLDLDWFGSDWSPDYRFLAVRKVSVS